ncbi:hypothetical protein [Streptomyces sp. NPDC005476]|uniref:hypothetical protein n=1 Tax=Streptomyces sp. NPDC005476 TaxID=3156882 RepID=UPI003451F54F
MLTHAAANLPLPDDVGMAPAHYGVHVEAQRSDNTGYTLLRLGPYFQTRLASRDADRLNVTWTTDGRLRNVSTAMTARSLSSRLTQRANGRPRTRTSARVRGQ